MLTAEQLFGGRGAGGTGGLIVSGGGQTAVSTAEVTSLGHLMQSIQDAAVDARHRLAALSGRVDAGPAAAALARVADDAASLATALRVSAEAYGQAERLLAFAGTQAGAWLGFAMGRLAPLIALVSAPRLLGLGIGAALGAKLFPGALGEITGWIAENPRLISNPLLVALVRVMVSSSDEALAGLFGIPPVLHPAGLRPELFGLPETAAVLVAGIGGAAVLAKKGYLRESAVRVRPTEYSSRPVAPPSGVGELIDRVPGSAEGDAQIRLERYPGAGAAGAEKDRWVLYLGGTIDLGLAPGTEPFDMTSNLYATAGRDAGSLRAAAQALTHAGVAPTDPVLLVGYSQGGLLAAQLERSGDFTVAGVLTVGAPIGQLAITAPTAAIAHTEDLVPALGGVERERSPDRILIQRSAFANREVPKNAVLPAHALAEYRATAAMIDGSDEARIRRYRDGIAEFLGPGADAGPASRSGSVRLYRAERLLGGGESPD